MNLYATTKQFAITGVQEAIDKSPYVGGILRGIDERGGTVLKSRAEIERDTMTSVILFGCDGVMEPVNEYLCNEGYTRPHRIGTLTRHSEQ